MKYRGILASLAIGVGVSAAMAVALDDVAVGVAIGAAVAIALLISAGRGPNRCAINPRIEE